MSSAFLKSRKEKGNKYLEDANVAPLYLRAAWGFRKVRMTLMKFRNLTAMFLAIYEMINLDFTLEYCETQRFPNFHLSSFIFLCFLNKSLLFVP